MTSIYVPDWTCGGDSGSNLSPLCSLTAVHMIAHLLNVEWYNNSRQGVYDTLSTALSNLEDTDNTTYLNPIRTTDLVSRHLTHSQICVLYYLNSCAHISSSSSSSCVSGSATDSDLLRLHHHRRSHGRHHHPGPHPHHHLLHGGHQTQLLWGLLVHPSPLHHLLRRTRLPRSRVRVFFFFFVSLRWGCGCCCHCNSVLHVCVSSVDALWGVNRKQIPRITPPFVKTTLKTGDGSLSVQSLSLQEGSHRFVLFSFMSCNCYSTVKTSPVNCQKFNLNFACFIFRPGCG